MPDNSEDLWIHVSKNGTEHSAVITIKDFSGQLYYFKLQASTSKGAGKVTQPVRVDPNKLPSTGKIYLSVQCVFDLFCRLHQVYLFYYLFCHLCLMILLRGYLQVMFLNMIHRRFS